MFQSFCSFEQKLKTESSKSWLLPIRLAKKTLFKIIKNKTVEKSQYLVKTANLDNAFYYLSKARRALRFSMSVRSTF